MALSAWGPAHAADRWETVVTGPLTVKTRDVRGSDIKEYLVEGEIDASVQDLQETLCDPERFAKFMPHVKEARLLERDGRTDQVYVLVEPPIGGSRDYVTEVRLLESVRQDGSGKFRQQWRALPKAVPERSGVTRITLNEGSWKIEPGADGRSRITYRFRVDPGGWVPSFVADMANKKAIPENVRAIESEAKRRGRERERSASAPLSPVQGSHLR